MSEEEAIKIEQLYLSKIGKGESSFKDIESGNVYILQGVKYHKDELSVDVRFTLRRLVSLDGEHIVNYETFMKFYQPIQ